MATGIGSKWFHAGGKSGGSKRSGWDLKPIYRSLTAAYGWTYRQIDEHTLAEVNELFVGWDEYPPTNILVKALVEGFGGGTKKPVAENLDFEPTSEAMVAMQRSAASAIAAKSGNRLPVVVGKDPGLPKAMPVFDFDEMRKRNADVDRRRALMKAVINV